MQRHFGFRVLLATKDNAIRKRIEWTFDGEGYEVVAASRGQFAFSKLRQTSVELAIIDTDLPDMDGFDLCRRFRDEFPQRNLPILLLIDDGSTAAKIRVFEAGADSYLVKPFHGDELFHTAKSLLARVKPATHGVATGREKGRIFANFGCKAGVGTTTLSVNMAVALRKRTKKRVALVDADFYFGDTSIHLDLQTHNDVIDLVYSIDELDQTIINQVLSPHSSGVDVLLSPLRPEQAELITPDHVLKIIEHLATFYDYIVIDCYTSYDGNILTILERADDLMLVTTPEISPIRNGSNFLNLADQVGIDLHKIHLVLNRSNSNVQIRAQEIENTLDRQIEFRIISSGEQIVSSLTRGMPLVLSDPAHRFSQQIFSMVDVLTERSPQMQRSDLEQTMENQRSSLLARLLQRRGRPDEGEAPLGAG